jgi:elongation factor Ts
MAITTAMIKELWGATGASLMDCKKALQANDGNFEKAAEYLREKGLAKAAQKVSRETGAGLVIVKEAGDSICAVQINCETDFVGHTDDFKTFAHHVADQVLADASLTNAEKLLAADYVPGKSIAVVTQEMISRLGENIIIRGVARYTSDNASTIVEGYVHAGALGGDYGPMEGRIGVLVELGANHAVDRNLLRDLARDLNLHIAALNPAYLAPDDLPGDVTRNEACLLKQAFVRDDRITIEELLQQKSREIGTPVTINRFVHFEVGA